MTYKSPLVLEGDVIKSRIEQRIAETGAQVTVDWLRFTVPVQPNLDYIFPLDLEESRHWYGLNCAEFFGELGLSKHQWFHAAQAKDLADECCRMLGEQDFYVDSTIKKGHDFYRFRISIMREGHEVGWVGFLPNSDKKNMERMAKTIHVNIEGAACTFGHHGWAKRFKEFIDWKRASITRVDLALDIFDAPEDFMLQVEKDYNDGLMKVGGRMPCCNYGNSDWSKHSKGARSFYVGKKSGGKQTNYYEKGDQLYGVEANNPWCRVELRYGNQLRVLDSDCLDRPADFFAGASDYHADLLRKVTQAQCKPEPVKCVPRLPQQTIEAEAYRSASWLRRVAAPSIAVAFNYLGDEFLELVRDQKRPQRLARFGDKELRREYATAFKKAFGIYEGAVCAG